MLIQSSSDYRMTTRNPGLTAYAQCLGDGDSGGGSVMVAIAVVSVLSSWVPVVQHLSPMLA